MSHIVCSQKSYMDVIRCFSLPLPSCCTFCKATLYLPASATTYNKKQTQKFESLQKQIYIYRHMTYSSHTFSEYFPSFKTLIVFINIFYPHACPQFRHHQKLAVLYQSEMDNFFKKERDFISTNDIIRKLNTV